jgi:hypothetical protein
MGENCVNSLSVTGFPGTMSAPAHGVVQVMGRRDAHILITDPPLAWRTQVVDRLNHLCRLPIGWNGYGAGPVNFNTANFALRLLESVCNASTPVPSIVPGASGDLQIEWHLEAGDVELHIRAPNDVHAWCETAGAEQGSQEAQLTIDFTTVAQWIKSLVESPRAPTEAAA